MADQQWNIWIDTGGTFTDCLAVDPAGNIQRAKVLSSSALRGSTGARHSSHIIEIVLKWRLPEDFLRGTTLRLLNKSGWRSRVLRSTAHGGLIEVEDELPVGLRPGQGCEFRAAVEAPILAAHLVTGCRLDHRLPPLSMRLATTRGTNALLERNGAKTALFITSGFADLLQIGTQQRPDLFALAVQKPKPLYDAVVEVPERLDAAGAVVEPLSCEAMDEAIDDLLAAGFRCAAVALMHAYIEPRHELELGRHLRGSGFEHVSCSAELAPLIKILPRAQTAVVDAYLDPVIRSYLEGVAAAVHHGRLHVMTSAGGLVAADAFRATDALLSGPAGGVVGAARAGQRSGADRLIAFDMGGTSTDVARWDGDFEYVFSHKVGDATLMAPALAIESVAAGGGSICHFDGGRMGVGPRSAGADPGPAAYGAGGPLTITDVNLLLGRIDPKLFEIPISIDASTQAAETLMATISESDGEVPTHENLLEGYLQIANERMAAAIRRISVRQGYDPTMYTLVAFGGAGPQHACAVADLLGVGRALIPPDASLLSASGLGHALIERFAHRQVLEDLVSIEDRLAELMAKLENEAQNEVCAEGLAPGDTIVRRRITNLRLSGQETTLAVEWRPGLDTAKDFIERYRIVYGYPPPDRAIEVESLRVVVSAKPQQTIPAHPVVTVPARVAAHRRALFQGRWVDVPILVREDLVEGSAMTGPALIAERHSVTVVEPGWRILVNGAGALDMQRDRQEPSHEP